MAEALLNLAESGAGTEHVGRKTVTQRVRRDRTLDAHLLYIVFDDKPEAL